ncbi:Major facilitator superfamily protein [Striga hermonthica]|uniref:Major facilitator superfamily protein n=1 Tax=Striga hermonthica TaxID=68872 RepID=A0A9N7RS35_STRHE|nr:Major facilitator superfamily protein [Striga hermonthica]
MAVQWLSLVAAIWLQSINGTNSNFPAYSSHLKRSLRLSQLRLNNLASASDAGKLFGWLSGVAASHLPLPAPAAGVSTVTAIGAMTVPMCMAFFLLAISRSDVALYLSTAVIGVCTGAITSVAVTMTTELFGAVNFGVNHNIVVLNIPIGSFGFGYLAALLYNGARAKGEDSCVGQACYRTTFVIWGCLCVLGSLLAFVLRWRSKKAARS